MRTCLQCGSKTDDLFCAQDGTATIVQGRRPVVPVMSPGALFAGRYRILGELGRGGMGQVYEALHTGTGQPVAIKTLVLDTETDESTVRRFFQEARVTAGLQHPNTVRVFDFGQSDDGVFYLAMERLRGQTLGDRLRQLARDGQVLGEAEATRVAVAVLRSLGEAHKAGLVHRDLKPMNVFLHEIDDEVIVKVLDFGIAKCPDAGLTRIGTTVGTPSFMAPEQVSGLEVDGRADLYALGVILFGAVSGQLPFAGESSYSVMMQQVEAPIPDLRERLRTATSEEYVEVVHRALAKDPDERFADACDMREALERAARRRGAGMARILAPATPEALDIAQAPTLSPSEADLLEPTWVPARSRRRRYAFAGTLAAVGAVAGLLALVASTAETSTAATTAADAAGALDCAVAAPVARAPVGLRAGPPWYDWSRWAPPSLPVRPGGPAGIPPPAMSPATNSVPLASRADLGKPTAASPPARATAPSRRGRAVPREERHVPRPFD